MHHCRHALPLVLLLALLFTATHDATAQTFKTLHTFTAGPDGNYPAGGLICGTDGYLYGTTREGGANNKGAVIRVGPDGVPTTLYSFTGPDAMTPVQSLLQASDGNFYGVAGNVNVSVNDATSLTSVLYRVTSGGVYTPLYTFHDPYGTRSSRSPLVQGGDGMLYGTTSYFKLFTGSWGEVYKIAPNGTGYTVVYTFPTVFGGAQPVGLVRLKDGSLLGATTGGGDYNQGSLFKISTSGAYSLFRSFKQETGGNPGPPMIARDGNLYGACSYGGPAPGYGCVYRLTPAGDYTVLHYFTQADGGQPGGFLVQAEDGDLYGTTNENVGGSPPGALFKISLQGAFSVVHAFSAPVLYRNAEGYYPSPYLSVGQDGNVYGGAVYGGVEGFGTLFAYAPAKRRMLMQNQTDRRISVLSLSGTTVALSRTVTPAPQEGWAVAAYADFDQDGQPDIAVQNAATRQVAILYLAGVTVRSSRSLSAPLQPNWTVACSGDFNGDGKADLVVQNGMTQQVSVLTLDGVRITGSLPLDKTLASGWRVVGAADFTGDGFTDLVAQNGARLAIVTLKVTKVTGSVPLSPGLPVNTIIGGVADYDGAGSPDLAVQDTATGRLSFISITNMQMAIPQAISPMPQAGWKLVGPR